jgi:exosortase A
LSPAPDPVAATAGPPLRTWVWAGALWLALVAAMIAANPGTAEFALRTWQVDAYGHSWLVVAISIWLVWRLRRPLLALEPSPSLLGMSALALIAVFWWLGYALEVRALQQLAMTAAVTGITWALLGTRVSWLLAFPLLYLFLTVSAWDVFMRPMQDATAALSAPLLRLVGVPVFQDGVYLWIPEGRFLVDETCAGLRYLLAGLAVGSLYAYLFFDDLWRRALFIALTAAYALALNVVRVAVVVYAGHVSDMQHPWVEAHDNVGWVLFAVGLVLLFVVGSLVQRLPPFLRLRAMTPSQPSMRPRRRAGAIAVAALVSAGLLAVAPAGAQWLEARAEAASAKAIAPQLPAVPGWDGPAPPPASWSPEFPAADLQTSAVYNSDTGRVYVYLGWYAYERADAKLLFWGNRLFDRRQWLVAEEGLRHLDGSGESLRVREQVLRQSGGYGVRVIWSWYRLDDTTTASAMQAKLLGLRGVLRGRPEAMVIAVGADAATPEDAQYLIQEWLATTEKSGWLTSAQAPH